jgi:hypothetical protein
MERAAVPATKSIEHVAQDAATRLVFAVLGAQAAGESVEAMDECGVREPSIWVAELPGRTAIRHAVLCRP